MLKGRVVKHVGSGFEGLYAAGRGQRLAGKRFNNLENLEKRTLEMIGLMVLRLDRKLVHRAALLIGY